MSNITKTSSNIHIDGRADFAVAIFLIDYLRTSTHQNNLSFPSIILELLMYKLQESAAYKKPSIIYSTPIHYLKQLCLDINPTILVPALADVLNKYTLEDVLQNPRAYTSYFLNITPHTLSQENIENNVQCFNPFLPSIVSRLLNFPFYISITSGNKTLPKQHPHATSILTSNTGIQLHWQNGHCLVSANIMDISHFEKLDINNFVPTTPLHLENIKQYVKHLDQEMTRSTKMCHTTKKILQKYMLTEKKTYTDMLEIYFNYLNRSIKKPSKYFDTLYGTQPLFRNTGTHDVINGLIDALARLLTLGEPLDITINHIKKDNVSSIPPTS